MRMDTGKGSLPLYLQVKNELKDQIERGLYPRGTLIPAEPQLEKIFDVSRITVRQAITELANEGYVQKARGKGTSVTYSKKIRESSCGIRSFTNEILNLNRKPGTLSVTIERVIPDQDVISNLEMEKKNKVYRLRRIRTADDIPIVLFETYIAPIVELPLDPEQYRGSMYDLFEEYGLSKPEYVRDTFSAMTADEELAKALDMEIGTPVLKRTRLAFDKTNRPIEYTFSYYNGSIYEYSIELRNR